MNTKINKEIYRFKFSKIMMEYMISFSNLHRFEDKNEFKISFDTWYKENNDIIQEEITNLLKNGFQGNEEKIKTKMYRSVRYYYRKKAENPNTKTKKKDKDELEKEETEHQDQDQNPKTKTKRFYLPIDVIKQMDRYIMEKNKKPSVMFEEFMNENIETLEKINNLENIRQKEKNHEKIKKSFKNRCYKINVK